MLTKKVAIVTGGSRGIGFWTALKLSETYIVYLFARSLESKDEKQGLIEAKEIIESDGGEVEIRVVDIKERGLAEKTIDEIYEERGRLDILVNNAGDYIPTSSDSSFEDKERIRKLDRDAHERIIEYVFGKFKKEKNNHLKILTVLSQAALRVFPKGLAYGSAKMGLLSTILHLREEQSREGISNIDLYNVYPATTGTESVMKLVRAGDIEDPMPVKAVVDTVMDLLEDRTETKDAYVGYVPGEGIKRVYMDFDPNRYNLLELMKHSEKVIDKDFDPKSLI